MIVDMIKGHIDLEHLGLTIAQKKYFGSTREFSICTIYYPNKDDAILISFREKICSVSIKKYRISDKFTIYIQHGYFDYIREGLEKKRVNIFLLDNLDIVISNSLQIIKAEELQRLFKKDHPRKQAIRGGEETNAYSEWLRVNNYLALETHDLIELELDLHINNYIKTLSAEETQESSFFQSEIKTKLFLVFRELYYRARITTDFFLDNDFVYKSLYYFHRLRDFLNYKSLHNFNRLRDFLEKKGYPQDQIERLYFAISFHITIEDLNRLNPEYKKSYADETPKIVKLFISENVSVQEFANLVKLANDHLHLQNCYQYIHEIVSNKNLNPIIEELSIMILDKIRFEKFTQDITLSVAIIVIVSKVLNYHKRISKHGLAGEYNFNYVLINKIIIDILKRFNFKPKTSKLDDEDNIRNLKRIVQEGLDININSNRIHISLIQEMFKDLREAHTIKDIELLFPIISEKINKLILLKRDSSDMRFDIFKMKVDAFNLIVDIIQRESLLRKTEPLLKLIVQDLNSINTSDFKIQEEIEREKREAFIGFLLSSFRNRRGLTEEEGYEIANIIEELSTKLDINLDLSFIYKHYR